MIELVFGDSVAGSLKQAKSMEHGKPSVITHYIFDDNNKKGHKEKKKSIWSGVNLEGGSTDVESFYMALDIGSIAHMNTDMSERNKVLDLLFGYFPDVSNDIWKSVQHTFKRLDEAKTTLEPIRMWVCESDPSELCSLCFVCKYMEHEDTPLSVVLIPKQIERNGCLADYHSTGEIDAEDFGELAKYEKLLSELSRSAYANIWNDLTRKDAPLRAIVNGSLMSVPQNFYDFALRANIPNGEFVCAMLVGKALIQVPGVGDRWLYLRIEKMIKDGELIEVSPATGDHPYSAILKRRP